MAIKLRWVHSLVLGAGLASPSLLSAGERCLYPFRCIDNCSTIPPGSQPAPNGTYMNRIIHIQETKAEMDDFVIYKHMWYRGGKELGPFGKYQLDMITHRLPSVPFPVVVETSKNDGLDEARREIIINLLAQRGLADPSRVIVAFSQAEGLYGDEAPTLYQLMLQARFFGAFGGFGGGIGGFGAFGAFGGFGGPGFASTAGGGGGNFGVAQRTFAPPQ
jgi:hypothetical protein